MAKLRRWEVHYTGQKARRRYFTHWGASREARFYNRIAVIVGEFPNKRAVVRRR